MTLAVCSRLEPPSIEFNIEPGLESRLLDVVHAVIAPHVPLGRLVVHVRQAREGVHGVVLVTLMQSDEDREGLRVFSAQVIGPMPANRQVIITRMALPEELRGQGRARAMARGLFEVAIRHHAAMVLCQLDEVAVARLVSRGAHRVADDAVQILERTQLQ